MTEHIVPQKTYVVIFGALLTLTLVTVLAALVDLGRLNVIVAITIAVIKALLVILYFMQVRYGSRFTWIFVGAGFFWLALLLALTMSDFLTRSW